MRLLSVSHKELLRDLRPLGRPLGGPNNGPKLDLTVSGRVRIKDKVLKDVTNRLVKQPEKTKSAPSRLYPKNGPNVEETMFLKRATFESWKDKPTSEVRPNFRYSPSFFLGLTEVQSNTTRPPDPLTSGFRVEDLEVARISPSSGDKSYERETETESMEAEDEVQREDQTAGC